MKSAGQMNQQIKLYSLADAGSGGVYSPSYDYQGSWPGVLSPAGASLRYAAAQAGEVVDAVCVVTDDAPLMELGVLADADLPEAIYLVSGIMPLRSQSRFQARCKRVDRGQYPISDGTPVSLSPSASSVSIPHGSGSALGVVTITPQDAYGFALGGLYLSVAKTAGSDSATAQMRGYLLDILNVPASPSTGDVFTVYLPNVPPLAIPVVFT